MALLANYHTHTTLCDGQNTPEGMAEEALRLGLRHLGFSGHMDSDIHMDWEAYRREISRLQERYRDRLDILCGVELDTLYDPECAPGAEYIIGSTHFLDTEEQMSVDAAPEQFQLLAERYFQNDYYALAKAYYQLEAQVGQRTKCTFVGHFDLVTRFNDQLHVLDEEDSRYLTPALETMEYLVSQGLPFEINCGAVNRNRKRQFYPNHTLLQALQRMGGEILISSDAHQRELLTGGFAQAVQEARSCGFRHVNILLHDENGAVCWRHLPLDTI